MKSADSYFKIIVRRLKCTPFKGLALLKANSLAKVKSLLYQLVTECYHSVTESWSKITNSFCLGAGRERMMADKNG